MNMRRFFTKKKIIWTIIILLIVGGIAFFAFRPKNNAANILTAAVSRADLKQTVLTTGQVVSETNLNLSFQASGLVKSVSVKNGSKVKTGDTLAVLDQANARSALTSASGQLALANANYQKVMAGSSEEQINVSKKAVDAAQVAYDNALSQLETTKSTVAANISQAQANLDEQLKPTTATATRRSAVFVAIANQLTAVKADLNQQDIIIADNDLKNNFGVLNLASVSLFVGANGQIQGPLDRAYASLQAAQISKSDASVNQAVSDALSAVRQDITALNYCYSALLSTITSNNFSQAKLDGYKSAINAAITNENSGITQINSARQALTDSEKADADALKADTDALANSRLSAASQITAAQNQVNSAKASLVQAQAALAQAKVKAQPADIAAAKAQIISAQGSYESARAAFDDTIIKAPADGTITQVNTKIGQLASALQTVFVLQNVAALHTEAYVSESNVASLKLGQTVDFTFDALGPDRHFSGKVLTIDPASTVISGVVDYLVKASLPGIKEIKPGMTVNMTILVAERKNALAVTSDAIINQDGKQYVRVIDDPKAKTYHQVAVQTGLSADGGLVEILGGLSEGQEIVTLIK